jgi:hypothetical protein
VNHAHNTHAHHHVASRSSRRHAWRAAARHSGRRPPWPGRTGADQSGQRPYPGQPRDTSGPAGTSPRRRSCGRTRARRPAGHRAGARRSRRRGTDGCLPPRPNPRAAAAAAAGRAPNARGPREAARTPSRAILDTAACPTGRRLRLARSTPPGPDSICAQASPDAASARSAAGPFWIPGHERRITPERHPERVDHAGKLYPAAGEEPGHHLTLYDQPHDAVTAVASTGKASGPAGASLPALGQRPPALLAYVLSAGPRGADVLRAVVDGARHRSPVVGP